MNVSRDILYRSSSHISSFDESEFEFAECICESMVSLGSTNLQYIAGNSDLLPFYIQQVIPDQVNSILYGTMHCLVPSYVGRRYEFLNVSFHTHMIYIYLFIFGFFTPFLQLVE